MNVLLVAPLTMELSTSDEAQEWIRTDGLHVVPLIGNVTRPELVADIKRHVGFGNEFEWIFVFLGHSSPYGLILSDGLLSPYLLAPLIRGRFGSVFLNSCDNLRVAQILQNETAATIIATVRELVDEEALQTGTLFAQALAATDDIREAFNASKQAENADYVMLAGF